MFKRWIRDERGNTAVEFALVCIPLIGLLLVSLQTAIVFFADQALQTATKAVSRSVMTGGAQTAAVTQSQFASNLCTAAKMFTCSGLIVDIESASSFSGLNPATITPTYQANGTPVANQGQYSLGNPGDAVILRVMYSWPIFGGPLAIGLANQITGTGTSATAARLLSATVVFKNEPYS